MKQLKTWKDGFILVFLSVFLSTALAVWYMLDNKPINNLSQNGVADLSSYSFEQDGLVSLSGFWVFEANQLSAPLNANEFTDPGHVFLRLPGSWNKSDLLENTGCVTYHLKLKLPVGESDWGLISNGIYMASEVFVNGRSVIQMGSPSCDNKLDRPMHRAFHTFFHSDTQDVVLTLHVSNYDFALGGTVQTLLFGPETIVKKRAGLNNIINISGFLIMLIFSMIFWMISRLVVKRQLFLLMAVYTFLFAMISIMHWTKWMLIWWPDIPYELFYRMKNVMLFGSLFLYGIVALRIYANQKLTVFRWMTWGVGLSVIPAALLDYWYFTHVEPFILIYFLLFEIVLSVLMFSKYLKGDYGVLGKGGSRFYQLATFCLINISFQSTLISLSVITNPIGIYLFTLLFAACLLMMLAEMYFYQHVENISLRQKVTETNQQKQLFFDLTQSALDKPLYRMNVFLAEIFSVQNIRKRISGRELLYVTLMSQRMLRLVNDILQYVNEKYEVLPQQPTSVRLRPILEDIYLIYDDELKRKQLSMRFERIPSQAKVVVAAPLFENALFHLIGHFVATSSFGELTFEFDPSQNEFKIIVHASISNEIQMTTIHDFLAKVAIAKIQAEWKMICSVNDQLCSFRIAFPNQMLPVQSIPSHHLSVSNEVEAIHLDVLLICRNDFLDTELLDQLEQTYLLRITDDWQEAQEMMNSNMPQIILLDYYLNGLSGFEICRDIRDTYSLVDLPVLFLTNTESSQMMNMILAAGGNGRIVLPATLAMIHEQMQRARELQVLANLSQEREMNFLQSQIKPHFLYNTLNAVISYSYVDEQKAEQMLRLLADYMKFIFRNESFDTLIPLHAEKSLIDTFVQISSLRMGREIELIFDVPRELENIYVMPFLIQPIVENAIIHGIAKRKEAGKVLVKIEAFDRWIQITVEDDGAGIVESELKKLMSAENEHASGIGLKNLQARLMHKMGRKLTIESKADEFTRVKYEYPIQLN